MVLAGLVDFHELLAGCALWWGRLQYIVHPDSFLHSVLCSLEVLFEPLVDVKWQVDILSKVCDWVS
jgi:hypothetical protein